MLHELKEKDEHGGTENIEDHREKSGFLGGERQR